MNRAVVGVEHRRGTAPKGDAITSTAEGAKARTAEVVASRSALLWPTDASATAIIPVTATGTVM